MQKLLALSIYGALWSSNVQARQPLQHDVFELVSRGQLSAPKIAQHLHFLLEAGKLPALHGAVVLRSSAHLQQLIRAGLDVNAQEGYQEWSPLHVAVLIDDPIAIKILLEAGAKTDVLDINHDYPTEMAAQWGRTKSLRTLIATTGLLPASQERYTGKTLLHRAVSGDNTETVAYLLDRDDIAVDASDRDGTTPLMAARSVAVAEQLLAAGADLSKKENRFGFSSTTHAIYAGNAELLEFFLKHEPDLLFVKDDNGYTPFLTAAERGHANIAQDLLARGANVDDRDLWDRSVLQIIVEGDVVSHELFAAMLDKVSDINTTNREGRSIAHYVAKENDAGLFDLLLQHKQVNLNIADNEGNTPLMLAAMQNKSKSVAILVQNGAELSPKNSNELTAFLLTVQRGAVEAATVLLETGGNAQLQHLDPQANNALHVLLDAYLNPNFITDRNKFTRMLLLLVEQGLDINSTDTQGNSILHKVVAAGKAELLDAILANGGDHELKNSEGKTPIDIIKDKWERETN